MWQFVCPWHTTNPLWKLVYSSHGESIFKKVVWCIMKNDSMEYNTKILLWTIQTKKSIVWSISLSISHQCAKWYNWFIIYTIVFLHRCMWPCSNTLSHYGVCCASISIATVRLPPRRSSSTPLCVVYVAMPATAPGQSISYLSAVSSCTSLLPPPCGSNLMWDAPCKLPRFTSLVSRRRQTLRWVCALTSRGR